MAEHWIDSATAVSLVIEGPDDLDGMRSLCARAHNGLVRTKASLYIVEQGGERKRLENTPLPAGFWWANGYEALEQNWTSGDFSTWIDQKIHLQAYGVTFALSGVLEMLRSDQRALITRRLSVAGNPAWMPAREASRFALTAAHVTRPRPLILEQARLGLIAGRAMLAQRFQTRNTSKPAWEEREWDVPTWFWASSLQADDVWQKWDLGHFSATVPASAGGGWMVLSGVHFLTESLQVLRPATEQASAPVEEQAKVEPIPATSKSGGRPPQPWWDDMWCAVSGLIFHGALIPERQADIENAMLTWAAVNGREISPTAVKPKARKLFEAYQNEGTNFLKG
jgi:hypothetical protein